MTRLEKEFNNIIDSMMFPTRVSRAFNNTGATYPPYNIIRLSDTQTVLEVAVAGFKESEVSVTVEEGYLKISGRKEKTTEASEYLYRGIGTRAFDKSFALSKDAKPDAAEYSDGILSVFVSYELPEDKKPKQIPISRKEPVYLTE